MFFSASCVFFFPRTLGRCLCTHQLWSPYDFDCFGGPPKFWGDVLTQMGLSLGSNIYIFLNIYKYMRGRESNPSPCSGGLCVLSLHPLPYLFRYWFLGSPPNPRIIPGSVLRDLFLTDSGGSCGMTGIELGGKIICFSAFLALRWAETSWFFFLGGVHGSQR